MEINEELFYKTVGKRLKARRIQIGLKQEDVAQRVGIERTTLTHIESARQKPALHQFFLLCRELHVAPEQIVPDLREVEVLLETVESPDTEWKMQIVGENSAITPGLSTFLRSAQSGNT